jgi:hypothetical protein
MTRWRATTIATRIEAATVFQVVAELQIIGQPTQMMMGDRFTLTQETATAPGVIVTARPGHIVVRMEDGRTLHLRPRQAQDAESGVAPPRGKQASDWTLERVS